MISVKVDSDIPFKSNKLEDIILPPRVIRVTKFDDEGVKDFAADMDKAHEIGQPIIPIVIDSYGGYVYSLLSMISIIKASRVPVATIIEGKGMSAGATLFAFGSDGHRYMAPDSILMIHEILAGSIGKPEEVKADSAEITRLNKQVFELMALHLGHRKSYFLDIIHERKHSNWYLDARAAIKHNIANHGRLPALEVTLSAKLSLRIPAQTK